MRPITTETCASGSALSRKHPSVTGVRSNSTAWRMLPVTLARMCFFPDDAGGYVCNHVFFTAAHLVATEFPGTSCGFVHLPAVQASDERLSQFIEIVRIWVDDQ